MTPSPRARWARHRPANAPEGDSGGPPALASGCVPKNDKRLAGPTRPLGSPEIPQFHLPAVGASGVFAPRLYGAARIHFADGRRKLDETRRVAFLLNLDGTGPTLDWDAARVTDVMPEHLLREAPVNAPYLPLPAMSMEVKAFTRWAKAFDRWLARTQRLVLAAKSEGSEDVSIGPKRGGVSVELVGIVWELG